MKSFVLMLVSLLLIHATGLAQVKSPSLDKSPLDISYYPVNYPVLKIQNKVSEPLVARVIYSRPQKNGRTVYGELVEYGKIWRLGANEATEIELYRDVWVGNQKLKKGRYSMFAIPYPEKWTIIFNKDTDTWGAFQYDTKKDVLRVDGKIEKTEPIESYSMFFEKNGTGIHLVIAWDDTRALVPFTFQ
jgi:hypothetical protein